MVEEIEEALRAYHDSNDYESRREEIINTFIDEVKEKLIG